MPDSPLSEWGPLAGTAAILAAGAAYAKTRLRRHADDPTTVELLQSHNAELRQLHADAMKRIGELEQQVRRLHDKLADARERLACLGSKVCTGDCSCARPQEDD